MAIQQEAPRVLVCDSLPEESLKALVDKGYQVDFKPKLPQEQLAGVIDSYKGLIVRSGKKITGEVLANADSLQVIARAGVGVDNIDVVAATQKGIFVANTPDGNSIAVAELAMAQMLAMARHTHEADISIRDGKWEKGKFKGIELRGKHLGILGLGNIGSAVAQRALGFEMEVVGYDPYMTEERAKQMGVKLMSLQKVLEGSDFITIHVPLTDKTRHLIDKEALKLVKPEARIINIARGGIIDEVALVEALNEGRLAGAALDVFEGEPNVSDIIRSNPKIILTPHLGASTEEAEGKVADEAVRAVIDVLEGKFPKGAVNLPLRITEEAYRRLVPLLPVAEAVSTLAFWLSEGRRLDQIEVSFLGEVSESEDLRSLRAALVRGLVSPVSEQTVNLINYGQIEKQRGLRISERRQEANGTYSSSVRVSLMHDGAMTSVQGVDAHGPRIVEINGYPVEFPVGDKKLLICSNDDQPGKVGQVATALGKLGVNIDTLSVGSHYPKDDSAMMVYTVDTVLTEQQINTIRHIEGVRTADFYTI